MPYGTFNILLISQDPNLKLTNLPKLIETDKKQTDAISAVENWVYKYLHIVNENICFVSSFISFEISF